MKKYFNATNLKLLAIVLMLCDHIHQMFVPMGVPIWLTYLGRPVFPLFLFLAAESFHYTHDRKKYLSRLLFGSWGMTIMTFVLQLLIPNKQVVLMNNAFGTFFVAGLYMLFWERFVSGIKEKSAKKIITAILLCFVPILTAAPLFIVANLSFLPNVPAIVIRIGVAIALLFPNILAVEGGFAMVVLGVAFYILRRWRLAQVAVLAALSILVYFVDGGFQWMMVAAAVPMLLYNGEKGVGMKRLFYIFYPAHIAILYIISTLIMNAK